jgi:hypothetical protein
MVQALGLVREKIFQPHGRASPAPYVGVPFLKESSWLTNINPTNGTDPQGFFEIPRDKA